MNVRLRMYKYCCSGLSAICAKGLAVPVQIVLDQS